MKKLMVGSNYDPAIPQKFKELNDKYESTGIRIDEVYGSIRKIKIFGSARPDFRVPDISLESFEQSVKELNESGILVNYTENTPIIDKSELDVEYIKKTLKYLEDIGIGRITVAHPLAMEIVGKYSNLPVEISTIYRANTPYQLRELKSRNLNINKICLDVAINRDFAKITKLKKEADSLGIEVELLANEFCISDCADRIQCYNEHAQCKTESDTALFNRYPMGICTKLRNSKTPIEWTRARFILPQSLDYYTKTLGIERFKVTGRTHPTPYILWVIEEYMKQNYKGNLLQLWADVKNIRRIANGAEDFLEDKFYIDSDGYGTEFIKSYENDQLSDLDVEYKFLNDRLDTYVKIEK